MNKKNVVIVSILSALALSILLIFIFYKRNTDRFLVLFKNYFLYAYNQDPISSFIIFFVLHAPYQIFILPGYTLFAIAAGFFLKDIIYAFLMLFLGTVFFVFNFLVNAVWTAIVYFLFRFSFQDFIKEMLQDEDYYKIFETKCKSEPLKTSLVIRFLFIPQVYKNFFLCIFDISFNDFYWPALAQYFCYLGLPLIIGHNLKSLTQFYHRGNVPNSAVYYSVLTFGLLFILSICLFTYLAMFAYRELNKMKDDFSKGLTETHKEDTKTQVNELEPDNVSQADSSKILKMDS